VIYQRGTISSVVSDTDPQEDIMPRSANNGAETGKGPERAREQAALIAKIPTRYDSRFAGAAQRANEDARSRANGRG
jgi:hypothetical protein